MDFQINSARASGSLPIQPSDPHADPAAPWDQLYAELRRLAAGMLRSERAEHTLQPTALVNEAFLKLGEETPRDRAAFFAAAATAMRRILVDHARSRNRLKRGGSAQRYTLNTGDLGAESPSDAVDLLALDEALDELVELDARKARLVELRFFAGITIEQAAEALGIARSTATEDWRFTRAWLAKRLSEIDP